MREEKLKAGEIAPGGFTISEKKIGDMVQDFNELLVKVQKPIKSITKIFDDKDNLIALMWEL